MAIRVAINGFGRIGRNILRAVYETGRSKEIEVVAINASGDTASLAHLTQYDTVHGRFPGTVTAEDGYLVVNGDRIKHLTDRNPENLPWKDLDIDVVHECTGAFTSKEKAAAHLRAGAKKVLISAPGGKDVDATIVYGVNQQILTHDMTVVSNASCTTNCLAPLAKPLADAIGIKDGLMTTIHAFTNDQVLTDVYHKDLRRARAATQSLIPTKTGAAAAVGLVLPELAGKLDGFAVRVPTINVSMVDLTFNAARPTSKEEINGLLKEASEHQLKGVLAYNELPLVSTDFNHTTVSSTYDATLTRVMDGTMVKVIAWYDNEWGFCCRMLDTTVAWMNAAQSSRQAA